MKPIFHLFLHRDDINYRTINEHVQGGKQNLRVLDKSADNSQIATVAGESALQEWQNRQMR